ncbi:MAG: thiol-activated cytolysin family protein [Chitinophagaceae bacterium]|nr:thiol-activated cytolysin family protein [Chitinophagaceae bacterium]
MKYLLPLFCMLSTVAVAQPTRKTDPTLIKTIDAKDRLKTMPVLIKGTTTTTAPASVYSPTISRRINIGNGSAVNVKLVRNVTTGGEPAFNKENKASLPDEKSSNMTCKVNKVTFTAESTTFMNGNNSNLIRLYPGAIYTFDDFFGGGYNEIVNGRNPIRIYTDQLVKPGGVSVITVNNPSGATVNDANTGLPQIRNSINAGGGGTDIKYRSFSSNSEAELAIKVSAGGSYGGFTASTSFNHNSVNNRYYLTIDVVKPMFTVKAEKPANGFFNDAAVAATPNMLYVKEITYGTRILANIELLLDKREDVMKFNAEYGAKGGMNFNLGGEFLSKTSQATKTVNAYVIGAPNSSTTFNVDKLEDEIRTMLATCTFQHARPIYYTLGDMDGSTVSALSATDEYTERTCVPDNLTYILSEASLEINTGADNKEAPSGVAIWLHNQKSNSAIYYQPIQNSKVEFPSNKTTLIGLMKYTNNTPDFTLESLQQDGLRLGIYYTPNFPLDAWKINGVTLVLKFTDQNGVPHPKFGNMRIGMNNAETFLDNYDRKVLTCFVSGNFVSQTSTVSK